MKRKQFMLFWVAAFALVSCAREKPVADNSPTAATLTRQEREVPLQPGGLNSQPETAPALGNRSANPYEGNYAAANHGRRLFSWYNCAGCHSPGGGGAIGPPLIDAKSIYGNRPVDIYETLVKGRKNGMPAFGGKIPESQLWELVTYVKSLSAESSATPEKNR